MKYLHYISALFFAGYFLLAGTGYNVINFCCNHCEDAGIDYLVQHSCEELHHNDSSCCDHDASVSEKQTELPNYLHISRIETEGNTCFADRHCEIKRINLSEFAPFSESHSTTVPDIAQVDVKFVSTYLLDIQKLQLCTLDFPPPELFSTTGRDILTAKQVLII